jgi:hypothetical protein
MVELVFIVCMLAQPAKCERIHPAFVEPMPLGACMRDGPIYAMRWLEEHPGWRLRAWRCGAPEA